MKIKIMPRILCSALFFAAPLIEVSFLAADLLAQTPSYQGKTITLIQGTAAGETSDMMVKAALPYTKTMNDEGLFAEAKKKQWDLDPLRGEELETLAREIMLQPQEVIERVKKLLE